MIAAASKAGPDWVGTLPPLKGRISRDADMARITWFRVGGPAEIMFRPVDMEDLTCFLAAKPADVPVTVVGVGSNLLVRDGGVPGVVIRLGRDFAKIAVEGSRVRAGTAALDLNVARVARDAGLAGMEFLCGVPGTVGGALRMNAGAYGGETGDVLRRAWAIDPSGALHELDNAALGFGYRHCGLAEDWIFTEAEFEGQRDDVAAISARMEKIGDSRSATQPTRTRTGGSTFANPPGGKAWQLIEHAGCHGMRVGGAIVSEQHCNFLINTGSATAADIERLGEAVRQRVRETSGIELQWEIRRIGVASAESGV